MIKSSAVYFLIDLIGKLSAFLLIPILTKSLSVSDYGLYSLILPIAAGLVTLSSLGFDSTFARFSYQKIYKPSIVFITFSSITTLSLLAFSVFVVSILVTTNTFDLFNSILIVLVGLLISINSYPRTFFIIKKDKKYFSIYMLSQLVTWFFGIIFLWKFYIITITTILFMLLLSYIISNIFSFYLYNKKYAIFNKLKFSTKYLKLTEKYRWPMYYSALVSFTYFFLDKFLILTVLDVESLGIFALSATIAGLVRSIGVSIQFAFQPEFYDKMDRNEYLNINKSIVNLIYASIASYVVFIFMLNVIWEWAIDERFNLSFDYILILTVAFIFETFYNLNTNFLSYKKESNVIFKLNLIFLFFRFFVYYVGVKFSGLIGLSYSILFIAIMQNHTIIMLLNRIYNFKIQYRHYIVLHVSLIFMMLLFQGRSIEI
jgi:O-antigen/teichoic acid export membrane protein